MQVHGHRFLNQKTTGNSWFEESKLASLGGIGPGTSKSKQKQAETSKSKHKQAKASKSKQKQEQARKSKQKGSKSKENTGKESKIREKQAKGRNNK